MIRLAIFLSVASSILSSVIYIDRYTLDYNNKVCKFSTAFTHDEKQNSVTNLTFEIYKPLTKMLIYLKIGLAENEHDRNYKQEFLRTVVDLEKLLKGAQQNPLLAAFVENVKQFMLFDPKLPLPPNIYRIVNFTVDSRIIPPLPNIRGFVQFRYVAKFDGIKGMQFSAMITYYGGLKH